jgi:hypothetical protein
MEELKLKVSKRAYSKLRAVSDWYIANCGESFSATLHKNVNTGMEQIRKTPTMFTDLHKVRLF